MTPESRGRGIKVLMWVFKPHILYDTKLPHISKRLLTLHPQSSGHPTMLICFIDAHVKIRSIHADSTDDASQQLWSVDSKGSFCLSHKKKCLILMQNHKNFFFFFQSSHQKHINHLLGNWHTIKKKNTVTICQTLTCEGLMLHPWVR